MEIIDTVCGVSLADPSAILSYWDSPLIKSLYFTPKSISKKRIEETIDNQSFTNKIQLLSNLYARYSLPELCSDMIAEFERDCGVEVGEYTLYLILGCGTATIYSIELDSKPVTVLCLESLDGNLDILRMYLAHEYTDLVRKQLLKTDIFESCVGERLVTEGIAENYSRECVPGKQDGAYCIVDDTTVRWVQQHREALSTFDLYSPSQIEDLFYMFADIDYPERTGYVYRYYAVKKHLDNNRLYVKDILSADWKTILGVNQQWNCLKYITSQSSYRTIRCHGTSM